MKRIVGLCFVLGLQGLGAFGQTNAAPPASRSVHNPEIQGQKAAAKPSKTGTVSGNTLSHGSQAQSSQRATFHRIEREGLLRVQGANYDPGAKLEAIFQPENDQMGETCIRDTVVLIFPTGH
jgi:hypothetical protein